MNSYSIILEKLVWGTFNKLSEWSYINTNSNNATSFQMYCDFCNEYSDKIKELGVIHFVFTITSFQSSQKFIFVKNILENMFISQHDKERMQSFIQCTQKHYHALNKFAFICKYKLASSGCSTDMYMNPICENDRNTITILQENTKYTFTFSDLNRIINKSLCNHFEFYAEPNPIKNPYNNIPFSKSNLYTIYFAIKKSNFMISSVFHNFFLSNFSLAYFINQFEYQLRNKYIENTCHLQNNNLDIIESDDDNPIYDDIIDMINTYNSSNPKNIITIHSDISQKIIVDIFKPYLNLYYRNIHSMTTVDHNKYFVYYQYMLEQFNKFNPAFGRRIIKKIHPFKTKTKTYITYNTEHIEFNFPINYYHMYQKSHIDNVCPINPDMKKYMEQSHPFPISFNNLNSTAHIYFNDDISVNDDNDSVS
jgi:hypothetical protein